MHSEEDILSAHSYIPWVLTFFRWAGEGEREKKNVKQHGNVHVRHKDQKFEKVRDNPGAFPFAGWFCRYIPISCRANEATSRRVERNRPSPSKFSLRTEV